MALRRLRCPDGQPSHRSSGAPAEGLARRDPGRAHVRADRRAAARARGRDPAPDGRRRGQPPDRLEQRMRELGIEIPPRTASTSRCGCACRRGSRPSTGCWPRARRPRTRGRRPLQALHRRRRDRRLLRDIRREERAHSRAVSDIRAGSLWTRRRRRRQPAGVERRPAAGRGRLDRIIGRESWHRRAAAGSAAPSTAPTTASRRCSGSSRASPARPAAPASCSPPGSPARSPRRCRWRPAPFWPSARGRGGGRQRRA